MSRISAILSRTDHRRIMEAEMDTMCKWVKTQQSAPHLNHADVIELVSRRRAILFVATEFEVRGRNGEVAKRPPSPYNPYPYARTDSSGWGGFGRYAGKTDTVCARPDLSAIDSDCFLIFGPCNRLFHAKRKNIATKY